jgi:hypothetical protein
MEAKHCVYRQHNIRPLKAILVYRDFYVHFSTRLCAVTVLVQQYIKIEASAVGRWSLVESTSSKSVRLYHDEHCSVVRVLFCSLLIFAYIHV